MGLAAEKWLGFAAAARSSTVFASHTIGSSTVRLLCMLLIAILQEYTVKVGRAIADEPAETAYPALLVSLGSGVSIIKVGGVQVVISHACRVPQTTGVFVVFAVVCGAALFCRAVREHKRGGFVDGKLRPSTGRCISKTQCDLPTSKRSRGSLCTEEGG